jgi:hypothetical protein
MGAAPPAAAKLREQVALISEITGLEAKRPVPAATLSRDEWKAWVEGQLREQAKPEEIRKDELLLRMFGLVPRDFDLRQSTVDLLGEQAAAVYDHRRKRMLFVEGADTAGMEDAVLIHELSHAVADQHFDMGRFLDKGPKSDEQQFARLAVVEGQAMWIMVEAMLRKMGQTLVNNGSALRAMLPMMGQMAASQYPVFTSAPLYMRESLLFPYGGGMVFQQAVVDRMGKGAFREVLKNPPVSTQQILHPELYFSRQTPRKMALAEKPRAGGYERLSAGDVGEFDLALLLREGGMEEKEAKELAAGWRGGAYELFENREEKRAILRWALALDSKESAERVLAGYRALLAKKAGGARFDEGRAGALAGDNQDGGFEVVVEGTEIRGTEGLPPRKTDGPAKLY